MSLLFDRVYKLEIGDGAEMLTIDGFQPEPAQIQFRTSQGLNGFITRAQISIYGMSRETRLRAYERYDRIKLTAGFREKYGEIFKGEIYNKEIIREGPENVMTFYCRSAGVDWTEATITKTFGAGTPMFDVLDGVCRTYGVPVEYVGNFDDLPKLISSLPLQMGTTSALKMLARQFGFVSIRQPNGLVVYRDDAVRDVIRTVNSRTGLVGTPRITQRGIEANLKMDTDIQLRDTIEITNLTGQLTYNSQDAVARPSSIGTGRYVVTSFGHVGDLYGDQWDTMIEGLNPRGIADDQGGS